MQKLAIIGSGDLGQLIAYHAAADRQYEVAGYFDDFAAPGARAGVSNVIGKIADIPEQYDKKVFDALMIGIGYKHFNFRKEIYDRYKGAIPFGKVIHSDAYTDPSCSLGEGVFILPGCVLDTGVVIGDNVLLNTASVIAHDSEVKAHTFLSPGVTIAGFVEIGECCNLGINTTVIDNVLITSFVQTGGGTVVIKNIEQKGLYVGNPARFIR